MAGLSTGFTCENGKAARAAAADVVWVGIDAGKASHYAVAVDADGKRLWPIKVADGQQPVEELIGRASQSADDGEVRWAVDLVSPVAALLIAVLLGSEQKVVYVQGLVVHGMARVFRGEGKTDAKEARVIADTARMRGDLAELTVTDELAVELAWLTSYRADAMANWMRGVNLSDMGPILGAQFLPATGGRPLDAFASRQASYADLVPVPKDSGHVNGNYRRPKRFNRVLRQVFYMMALFSIRPEGPSKAFYQHKRDESKLHTQALLALARRAVDVLWALLRDNRTWSSIPPSQIIATAA